MSTAVIPASSMPPVQQQSAEDMLCADIAEFYDDPLGFVKYSYPWGESGPLKDYDGPDAWQTEALEYIGEEVRKRKFDGVHPVEPVRISVPSGHGTGKGALAAWIVDWIMSTRPASQGTVTANTAKQLSTKTWAAIQRWTKLCITRHWFEITSEMMWFKDRKEDWKCTALTCAPENAEAFQGQHAPNATSFYILDECSNIAGAIFEAAYGGLTDGEPMIFAFGQPTRANGEFYDITYGARRERWKQFPIDSRNSKLTNKQTIAEWLADYGEDSDYFRVHVAGLPPKSGDLQFIGSDAVAAAQKRELPAILPDEPLIMGIDYARGGIDKTVARFRRGIDARSIKPVKIPGDQSRDSMRVAARIAEEINAQKPDVIFGDATGGSIGGPINDRLRQLGYKVIDVQFGGESPDPRYENLRAYMWAQCRDWLPRGCIDGDRELAHDLCVPGSRHSKRDKVILESKEDIKKRGEASPDNGDALCVTFAAPVAPIEKKPVHRPPAGGYSKFAWMG